MFVAPVFLISLLNWIVFAIELINWWIFDGMWCIGWVLSCKLSVKRKMRIKLKCNTTDCFLHSPSHPLSITLSRKNHLNLFLSFFIKIYHKTVQMFFNLLCFYTDMKHKNTTFYHTQTDSCATSIIFILLYSHVEWDIFFFVSFFVVWEFFGSRHFVAVRHIHIKIFTRYPNYFNIFLSRVLKWI